MTDGYEYRYGLAIHEDDSYVDTDGDGVSNLEEFIAGTPPSLLSAAFMVPITRQILQ